MNRKDRKKARKAELARERENVLRNYREGRMKLSELRGALREIDQERMKLK